MVSGQDKCKELERNELGQPIGDNSVKYASFLGCMIKEFVPYTLDGWNEIGEEVKDRMWSCLQVGSGGIGSGIGNEVGSNCDINDAAKKIGGFHNVNKNLATAQRAKHAVDDCFCGVHCTLWIYVSTSCIACCG
ncbi:hypothetical protein ZIOFF_061387 [Zingiber officinale]|uniref:Uncharacterized protein n=1 Tax=Zingiber officinale TaxID=94328 RepID=A0A8J5K8A7_ZINOF|nr:hypothetical protein ZIOFF_061387 [Zingiber officinale]